MHYLEFFQEAFSDKIPIVVITNQSGIQRGMFDWDTYGKITDKMLDDIAVDFRERKSADVIIKWKNPYLWDTERNYVSLISDSSTFNIFSPTRQLNNTRPSRSPPRYRP